jgi:hypothetical protein
MKYRIEKPSKNLENTAQETKFKEARNITK